MGKDTKLKITDTFSIQITKSADPHINKSTQSLFEMLSDYYAAHARIYIDQLNEHREGHEIFLCDESAKKNIKNALIDSLVDPKKNGE